MSSELDWRRLWARQVAGYEDPQRAITRRLLIRVGREVAHSI